MQTGIWTHSALTKVDVDDQLALGGMPGDVTLAGPVFRQRNTAGGEPANFLDVGGGANAEQVTEAFRILLSDKNVKAVLVNIFGGIMRCTTIASAVVEAYKTVGFNVPLVVRLEGTEVQQGKKILAESGVAIVTADDLTDAAKKVVAAVK